MSATNSSKADRSGYEIVEIAVATRRIPGTRQRTRPRAYRVLRGTVAPFVFVGQADTMEKVDAIIAKDRAARATVA